MESLQNWLSRPKCGQICSSWRKARQRDAPRPGPGSKEQEVRKPCIPVSLLSYPCASKTPTRLGLRILLCPVRELDKKVTRSPSAQGILDSSRIQDIKAVAPRLSLRPPRNRCPCKAGRRTSGLVAVGTDFALASSRQEAVLGIPEEAGAQNGVPSLHHSELEAIRGWILPQNPWPPPWGVRGAGLPDSGPWTADPLTSLLFPRMELREAGP